MNQILGLHQELVQGIIPVSRIMVKETELFHSRAAGQIDDLLDAPVPPSPPRDDLLVGVLGIGDQEGGIADEFLHQRFVRSSCLVIRKEDDIPLGGVRNL